jgi:indole-3-glycerol phosphate synthase
MTGFVQTDTILDKILAQKDEELALVKGGERMRAASAAYAAAPARDFAGALRRNNCVALIAEVKKASPSKGVLIENFDPVALGKAYEENGAAAISVLTDEKFFQGHLNYMRDVRAAVNIPVLRKEFVIDPYQVYAGREAGADAVLLIVAALTQIQLEILHQEIVNLCMAALVEVHNEKELDRALNAGATLIGVNNRDLKTFREDLETTERLAKLLPSDRQITLVAESAIRTVEDVRRMGSAGAHAVLVGEGLVKAGTLAEQVRMFSTQPRGTPS